MAIMVASRPGEGVGAWRDSGTTEAGVPAGPQRIEYASLAGWVAPATQDVTIAASQTTLIRARYARPTDGALSVTISPPEAAAVGARWRRQGSDEWLESGATDIGLTEGSYTVEFKPLATDWIAPAPQNITIQQRQTARFTATYSQKECDLLWSTYLGGTEMDTLNAIAVDSQGNILVAGVISTDGWTSNSCEKVFQQGASNIACVVKLSPDGHPIWRAHLGGGANVTASAIVLDALDNVYITGGVTDGSWVSGVAGAAFHGETDAYVAKLSPSGRHLWSACLGGSQYDVGRGICLDPQGNICVTGETNSPGWISSGYDFTLNGQLDAFVAQLGPDGKIRWSSYLGGNYDDYGNGVATDGTGNVYICGYTNSSGWVSNGYDTILGAPQFVGLDGFVAKLSPTGAHLWSTYVGGAMDQYCMAIAVDAAGNAAVAGSSTDSSWLGDGTSIHSCAFAVRLTPEGQFAWGKALGAGSLEYGQGIAMDSRGDIFVTGPSRSPGWLQKGFKTTLSGTQNAFVIKLGALTGRQLWGSYLGGNLVDSGTAIAASGKGDVYVAGQTVSSGWTSGGFDTTLSTRFDGFVARIHDNQLAETKWGALRVNITPAEAVSAGAQWRRVGTSLWRDSGSIEKELPPGPCQVEFLVRSTWAEPALTVVTINADQITSLTAAYRRQTGSLRVDIAPPEAVSAGAQWRRKGTDRWWNSGETESGITAGYYNLEYKPVAGWTPSSTYTIIIQDGQVTTVNGAYTRQTGSLLVTLTPLAAVAAGAQWRRAGTQTWRLSGVAESDVPAGTYTIECLPVTGWVSPQSQAVTVAQNQVAQVSLAYAPRLEVTLKTAQLVIAKPGEKVMLGVAISGSAPVSVQWKKAGVALNGKTSPDLILGSCQAGDEGVYTCVARNMYFTAESAPVRLVVNEAGPVLAYLLGLTENKAGLDLTGDGRVEASDLIKTLRTLKPTAPVNPAPANTALRVTVKPMLNWDDCRHARAYDLYVWPANATRPATPTAAGLVVSQWQVGTPLARRTGYRWQVVARGDGGTVSGPVWSFTTEQ